MTQVSIREKLDLQLTVPRGVDAYWKIIRELDEIGAWSVRDIADQTNVNTASVRDFVRRLEAGRFAVRKGTRPTNQPHKPAPIYRLLKAPHYTPRLRRDGSELPECINDRLWRTMKMAKRFTSQELTELASDEARMMKLYTVKKYIQHLVRAGIVQTLIPGAGKRAAVYRVGNNIGPQAPKILRCHSVYDPNKDQIVGETLGEEVTL